MPVSNLKQDGILCLGVKNDENQNFLMSSDIPKKMFSFYTTSAKT